MWIEMAIDLDFIIHYKRIPPPQKKRIFLGDFSNVGGWGGWFPNKVQTRWYKILGKCKLT